MEIRERYMEEDSSDGTMHVIQHDRHIPTSVEVAEARAEKQANVVWYIVSFFEAILALRFIFHLFGAANSGFAAFIYNLSNPLVAPFRGIFEAPAVTGGSFDSAALLAMLVVALIGWGVVGLIDLANRPSVPTAHVH
jgi:uncharacterized protein YggT (Ycf19 family)